MANSFALPRLLLGILAIGLAWQAQIHLSATAGTSWLFYGLALLLFLLAFAGLPLTSFAGAQLPAFLAEPPPQPLLAGRRARFVLLLLGLALLFTVATIIQFLNPVHNGTGWLLHLASLACFLCAFLPFIRAPLVKPPAQLAAVLRRAGTIAAMLAILALALFARVWQLDRFPFGLWYDEANDGLAAMQILHDSSYRPVYVSDLQMPAHFDYLVALSFQLFGIDATAIRLVTVAFGLLTVLFTFLLFRRWFGTRTGLAAATLMAVMRYDLTFSRIALHGVITPPFELAVLYFLDRGLARKQLSDFAWAGLTLGLGLNFYFAYRLFPFVLVAFAGGLLLMTLARSIRAGDRLKSALQTLLARLRFYLPHLALFSLGLLIALAPFGQYALQHSDEFSARVSYVSIFDKRDNPDLAGALWNNFSKHMLMFNLQGDSNGRHNLPGEPMLDPLSGALFVLGFGYALWRWRDPANALMILLFFIMLMGGVLSVDFEAPQALRSIGVIPALIYFATIPLAAVARSIAAQIELRLPALAPLPIVAPLLAAVLLVISGYNFDIFFNKQMNSPAVWLAHSTAETIAAYEMKRLALAYDLVIASSYAGHPTVRFLAPGVTQYQVWTASDHVPLQRASARGTAMILDPILAANFDEARRLYQSAQYFELLPPQGGNPLIDEAEIRPADFSRVQGVNASYYAADADNANPLKSETLPQVNLDWTRAQPVAGPFVAELRSTLNVPVYGQYRFALQSDPQAAASGAELFIDENPAGSGPITLAKGNHALRLRVPGGKLKLDLLWQQAGQQELRPLSAADLYRQPVTNSGLLGSYYRSPDWQGSPAFTQIDPEIEFYFHNLPLPRPYSVEWQGRIYAPVAGSYRFATESIDDSHLLINGKSVVDNTQSGTLAEGQIDLAQGWQDITLRFADQTSYTHIYLYWTVPGGAREMIPSRYLSPPMGRYPSGNEIAHLPSPAPVTQVPAGQRIEQPVQTAQVAQAGPPASAAASNPATELPAASFDLQQVEAIGKAGSGPGEFREPRAVAIGKDGRIYVADTGNKRVQILAKDSKFISFIEGGEVKFVEPLALAVTSSGDLIVLDSEPGWLYRFDPDGKPLGRFGGPQAQLYHPRGLAIDTHDILYIADTGGARIVEMDLSGQRLAVIGAHGNGQGQFMETTSAVSDTTGSIYATDVPDRRIEMLDSSGSYILEFGIPTANSVNGPHIALAPDQSLFVTAPEQGLIQRYSRDGKLLGEWGDNAGEKLSLPTGIAVAGNSVWIVDTGNNRIQQWAIK